jgi:hypothetical protein
MTKTTTKKPRAQAPLTITRAVSLQHAHGTPSPTLTVSFPQATSQRAMRAELFTLAAKIELASEAQAQQWIVHVGDTCGWPYISMEIRLELANGTPTEAADGLAVLSAVAGGK